MAPVFRNMFIAAVVAVLVAHAAAQCSDCQIGQSDSVTAFCDGAPCTNCGTCGTGIYNGGYYCTCGSGDDLCDGCPNYV